MSLVCYECNRDLEPGEELPGREGTLVYPNLQALIYLPENSYKIAYLQSKHNRSLCFACIEGKLPEQRKGILKAVYDCYEAETNSERIEEEQKGKWISGPEHSKYADALRKFVEKKKTLISECLFCGNDVKNGKPFFTAVVIDRVKSTKHKSIYGSYSWSNLETGSTYLRICFDHFKEYFPRSFKQLSYDMLGEENPNFNHAQNELYISPSFEKALEKEGKSIDELIDDLAKGGAGNLKVIREEK